jgi:hypothetical protein
MSGYRIRHALRTVAASVIITLLFTPSAWSWGRLGHRVAARIADDRLTPAAMAAIHNLLGPGLSLDDISTWADEQREIPGTAPWHYVNVPIAESRYDPKFCQPKGCVVSKVEDFRRALLDPKAARKEKQQALKFLVHYLQDLHQPVHVGDNGDRGGNDLQLRWFNVGTNLHRLLDSQLIDRHSRDESQWAQELNALATKEKSIEWSQGSLADWATDSLEAAKLLYRQPGSQNLLKSGTKLNDDYYRMALPIIEKQLAKAGIRVAWMLNSIFR